jgi:hypothetical protein
VRIAFQEDRKYGELSAFREVELRIGFAYLDDHERAALECQIYEP